MISSGVSVLMARELVLVANLRAAPVLTACDRMIRVDLHDLAVDGCITQDVRWRLLRDAAAAGVGEPTVEASIHRAVEGYALAPVRAFLGVLVERDVRAELPSEPP